MSAKGPNTGEERWPKDRLVPRSRRVRDEHLAAVLRGEEFLLLDGAMGTQLQARGLAAGELPSCSALPIPQRSAKCMPPTSRGCGGRPPTPWRQRCQAGRHGKRCRGLLGGGGLRVRGGCPLRGGGPWSHGPASRAHGAASFDDAYDLFCRAGACCRRCRRGPLCDRDHGGPCRGEGGPARRAREL